MVTITKNMKLWTNWHMIIKRMCTKKSSNQELISSNNLISKRMKTSERKKHWENIYQTKELKDVSWFQPTPETSLSFFQQFNVPKSAKIIDIGGGDSFLVDH